jgi:aspartyl-tRNA(Asn)/glutamyl-tRNA(Gln) amidotransferase subunit A
VTESRSVDAALEGIGAWQERTNAFAQVFADEARAAADAGGRLAGLPIAVKDLFDVRGHPTTGCCAAIPSEPAERDAALVTRLRDEGAIVIGKTNQHELAAGVTNLESSCGPTRNPWDLQRITGGSTRIPAAFCGNWGLKPTQGRLPTEGMMSLAPEMDCPGLLAGSLDDLRLGWEVLAGRPNDRTAPSVVALLRGGRWERCALEIKSAVGRAAERFRDTGVEVRDVDGSALDDVHRVWNRLAWPPFAQRYAGLTGNPSLGAGAASLLEWGSAHRDELPDARARAERIRGWFADAFDRVDLFLAATTPYVAPPIDAGEVDLGDGSAIDVHRGGPSWHTTAANVAGLPALSVPFATSSEGLPIGVQLIGRANLEDALLAGADLLGPWGEEPRRPAVPSPR